MSGVISYLTDSTLHDIIIQKCNLLDQEISREKNMNSSSSKLEDIYNYFKTNCPDEISIKNNENEKRIEISGDKKCLTLVFREGRLRFKISDNDTRKRIKEDLYLLWNICRSSNSMDYILDVRNIEYLLNSDYSNEAIRTNIVDSLILLQKVAVLRLRDRVTDINTNTLPSNILEYDYFPDNDIPSNDDIIDNDSVDDNDIIDEILSLYYSGETNECKGSSIDDSISSMIDGIGIPQNKISDQFNPDPIIIVDTDDNIWTDLSDENIFAIVTEERQNLTRKISNLYKCMYKDFYRRVIELRADLIKTFENNNINEVTNTKRMKIATEYISSKAIWCVPGCVVSLYHDGLIRPIEYSHRGREIMTRDLQGIFICYGLDETSNDCVIVAMV
jgi:hypothetical protein